MIVDDSLVFRGLASRWLSELPHIAEVVKRGNADDALRDLEAVAPDLVILDVYMPGRDGFSILPAIRTSLPQTPVIVVTGADGDSEELAARARKLGAHRLLTKPSSAGGAAVVRDFHGVLVDCVNKALPEGGGSGASEAGAAGTTARSPSPTPGAPGAARAPVAQSRAAAPAAPADGGLTTRPASSVRPRIVAIGGSTGGPRALMEVVGSISQHCGDVPVVIVQHMPDSFTVLLAEHLARKANRECRRPVDGEPVKAGVVYVAPGERHLVLEQQGNGLVFRLVDGPPVNFCKPAVDPMFESVAAIFKAATLAVILTGMGQDGLDGARAVTEAGGTVIVQDEASSVVWGMPGVVARAGLSSAVLPVEKIGPCVSKFLAGGRIT